MPDYTDAKVKKIVAELQTVGHLETPGTTEVRVYEKDENGYVQYAKGTAVPQGEAGYGTGCEFVDTDGAAGAIKWFNEGDATTSAFVAEANASSVNATSINIANGKVIVGDVTGKGAAKTLTTPASSSAPAFTGTAPVSSLNLATPAFSGTGLTAAGQVITTSDNQTMTLNQCAGMWLIPATGATPAVLILSNTAVTGAPAVLTVQGAAMTDAGAYKIVKSLTPAGTVAAPTITATPTFT